MCRHLLYACFFLISSATFAAEVQQVNKATDEDFESEVIKSNLPVVVHFYADWCSPCKMNAFSLEELAIKMTGRVGIVKVDVDESPATPAKYEIRGVPTLVIFKNGVIVSRQVG